ncbi:hypothetical protein L218DRAFT_1072889 [Marasmius fiardii PR-910]|nr:hypothetical protein L218DRAFT_1072889 [Marasmius fiardii PR-910]
MANDPSLYNIRGCIGSTIAIAFTIFRLSVRMGYKKLWWDDAGAVLAMIAMSFFMAGIIIFTDPRSHERSIKIAGYMIDHSFYGVIWCARASLFLTLVRIAFGRFRTILKCCVVAVILTWAALSAQLFWMCEELRDEWEGSMLIAQCRMGKEIAITQLISSCDCLFDSILIASPVYLLRDMMYRRGLKIRLIAVFSSTIATTAFSLAHGWAIIKHRGTLELMFAALEVFVSLVVANLIVVVSWLAKVNDNSDVVDSPSQQINTFLRGRLMDPSRDSAAIISIGSQTESDSALTKTESLPKNHILITVRTDRFTSWR